MTTHFLLMLLLVVGFWSSCVQSEKPKHLLPEAEIVMDVEPAISSRAPSVIYRSTDGGRSWVPYAHGIPAEATVSTFLSVDRTIYATTMEHGIYRIIDGDLRWVRVDDNLPEHITVNALTMTGNVLILGTYKHGIFISIDGGHYWEPSTTSMTGTPIRSLLSYKNTVLAGTDDGIYKSVDQGNTWQPVFRGAQTNGFTILHNKIYAALMNGALVTHDEGASWNYIYQPRSLHDISNDGEYIYAMTLGAGLLKSNSDGLTWEKVNAGFGDTRWYTFEIKYYEGHLFAAQWHGIYIMDQNHNQWQVIKNGLPDSTAFSSLEVTSTSLIAGVGLRKKIIDGTDTH